MKEQENTIGLADALEALRAELAVAREKSAGADVQLPIGSFTVELKVGVTKSVDGKAGFKVPLLGAEAGGSASYERESIQTITLVFGPPVDREGGSFTVASSTDEVKG